MSYPTDIDEVSDQMLIQEVLRRRNNAREGKCSHCGYAVDHSDYPKTNVSTGRQSNCSRPNLGKDPILAALGDIIEHRTDGETVLTFGELQRANVARVARWHDGGEAWNGADWGNAMAGEAGELVEAALALMELVARVGNVSNTIKKLRRHESHVGTSYNTPELAELQAKVGKEIADVWIYCSLVAWYYGVDPAAAITAKFNAVSEAQDFPERLGIGQ